MAWEGRQHVHVSSGLEYCLCKAPVSPSTVATGLPVRTIIIVKQLIIFVMLHDQFQLLNIIINMDCYDCLIMSGHV